MRRPRDTTTVTTWIVLFGALVATLSATAGVPGLSLEWLGRDADKVSKQAPHRGSDGALDHHFRLSLQAGAAAPIRAIELREHDPARPETLAWNSRDEDSDHLAVERDGRRLNRSADASLGSHPGDVVFDLYAHDIGQWEVYRSVIVEVQYADGSKLQRAATLTWPNDRLMGIWQLLCPPESAEAFEPRTMSERVLLILQADGKLDGYFGSMPLSGTVDANGRVEGRAGNADADVEWHGALLVFGPGKPAVGSGEFAFKRSKHECIGEGQWTSK